MERKEAIRSAYRMTGGNNFYDGMITCSTLSGKAVCRLVWDMNKAENDVCLEKALSGIPEHFSGRLLEVPVGTGILTMPIYQTMPEADITCLDYSADMMGQAQEKTGFFTPPYETASSLKNRLERMYAAVTLGNVKAWHGLPAEKRTKRFHAQNRKQGRKQTDERQEAPIPEMSQGKHSNIGTIFFAVGFSVMMTLDVALG